MSHKHKPEYSHSYYLEHLVPTAKLKQSVRAAVKVLKRYEFDAIAFRGLSGALIAPTLALRLNKSLLAVRKPKESEHTSRIVEGDKNATTYVIVDDFISSGHTVRTIRNAVKEFAPKAECIGVLEIDKMYEDEDEVSELKDLKDISLNINTVGFEYWDKKKKAA